MSDDLALQARGITKRFPGVVANDGIDLDLRPGEVLALLGENGAGKSTLVNILYGLYHPDEGTIRMGGEEVRFSSPQDAIRRGIGMVHQHFQLVPVMTVTENIMLGAEVVGRAGLLDRKTAAERIGRLSQDYRLKVDPEALVEDLPVGTQQRVEIIKALYRRADILILDEPTAVLTPQEAEDLFRVMRELTGKGVSIIFITHKLKEVLAVADRIGVLRQGRLVGSTNSAEATEQSLAEMMVGRRVLLRVEKAPAQPDEQVLVVEGLTVDDDRGQRAIDDVTFAVRSGEVLGVAGVEGNGQRELVEAITGLRPVRSGRITITGVDATGASPRRVTGLAVSHIPEDREKHGLVMAYSVADNLVLNRYYDFGNPWWLDHEEVERNALELVKRFDVRTPSITTLMGSLSGGNKQKCIVAREFSHPVRLLVAAQPTRGIDVGSIEFVHRQIIASRDEGVAVLLVSAELDEVLSLADRIVVMCDGRIIGAVAGEAATREEVGLLMAGVAAS
ncbi:MAG: ABC transporter ATP-binding protein [Acidimicrobiia bacterium]